MEILIIGPVPPKIGSHNPGGVAHHVWSLATNLKDKGNEVTILAIGRYFKKTQYKDGILIHGFDKKSFKWGRFLFNTSKLFQKIGFPPSSKLYGHALYSLFRLSKIKDIKKFDVIHIHGWYNLALYALNILNVSIPTVVTTHSYHEFLSLGNNKKKKRIKYINKYYELADCLIHVSKADRAKGRELGLEFDGVDEVVYNGTDITTNYINISERSGICFVGSLIPRKRISLLLNAIKYLETDIQRLDIMGDGPEKKEIVDTSELNSLIEYHGILSNEEVRKILRSSSLLVVPSLSESFGLVYIEALFEGAAVIGYEKTIKEFQEVMELTEEEKKLVDPFTAGKVSPDFLAQKIDLTYNFRNSSEGQKLMERVRNKAISTFSWDSVIDRMENIYRKVK